MNFSISNDGGGTDADILHVHVRPALRRSREAVSEQLRLNAGTEHAKMMSANKTQSQLVFPAFLSLDRSDL